MTHGEKLDIPPWVDFYLKLWQRARDYHVLPEAGGLLDQDERTMRIFDIITREYDAHVARLRARAGK